MEKKKCFIVVVAAILVFAVVGPVQAQKISWKMASAWPGGTQIQWAADFFAESVNQLSGGRLEILYNLRDAINQVESKAGITYGKGTTRNVKVECVDKPVARVAVGGSRLTVRARRDYLYYTPKIAVSASGATLSWSLANLGTTTAGYGIIASNGGSPGAYGTGYAAATTEVTGLVPVKIVNIAAANELISVPLDLPINYGAILEFVLPDIAVAAAPNNISWSFSLNWEPRCRGFERMRSAFMLEKSVAYFGIWNFLNKMNLALAAGLALPLLAWLGYRRGTGPEGIGALSVTYALIPSALKLAAAALLAGFPARSRGPALRFCRRTDRC